MIGAVTGGRDVELLPGELDCLVDLIVELGVTVLRHGDAAGRVIKKRPALFTLNVPLLSELMVEVGVDRNAARHVRRRLPDVEIQRWPAHWSRWGKSAGPIRNGEMLAGKRHESPLEHGRVDVLFRFRGGRGTADCETQALARGIRVIRIDQHQRRPSPWRWGGFD